MLNSAAVDAAEAGVKINFIKGDIRNFELEKKFALIIFPFNAIAHLLDLKSLISCFLSVKKHMRSNGKFVFDFFNPNFKYFLRDPNERFPVQEYLDPDSDDKVIVSESNVYDRATQINHIKWYYDIGGKESVYNLDMRIFFPQELDALLIHNGFRIDHKFGDFEGNDFTSDSPKQIYVCSVRR
jgi:hypothetical protein